MSYKLTEFKDLTPVESKLKPLFWDYLVDPAEAYDVLMGKRRQAGPFDREKLIIRLLERLSWYDLLEIFGQDGVKNILTPGIIHKLRFPYLKERYEFIRRILHKEPVRFTGWSPENRSRVGATILSHRRYGAQ